MSHRVGKWARELRLRLRRSDDALEPMPPPELPYLHTSGALFSLDDRPIDSTEATTNSLIFTRLPPEIRRQILISAFGGRSVHMDLRECPPLPPHREQPPVDFPPDLAAYELPHGGVGADLSRYGAHHKAVMRAAMQLRASVPETNRNGKQHAPWQWWSCVCHRNTPHAGLYTTPVSQDQCVHGEAQFCVLYGGSYPGKCLIGCMGWLLTCRQAYEEGIDVLYGTNTVFIGSERLLDALLPPATTRASIDTKATASPSIGPRPPAGIPRALIPMHHLARIRKLEIAWEHPLFQLPAEERAQTQARATMAQTLARLTHPDAFPSLQSLVLAYGDRLYGRSMAPENFLDEIDEVLFRPLGELFSEFKKRTRNFSLLVEIPTNTFGALYSRAWREGGRVDKERQSMYFERRFWWNVSTTGEEKQDQDVSVGGHGFWVRSGIESNLMFDYEGKPYRPNTVATCF